MIPDLSAADQVKRFLAQNTNNVTLAHFWAPWHESAKQMKTLLEILSEDAESKSLKYCNIQAEKCQEIAVQLGVTSVPTFVFIQNGKPIHTIEGARAADVTKRAKLYGAHPGVGRAPGGTAVNGSGGNATKMKENLTVRLKALVNHSTCMVFMKGSPSSPKCGFSKQLLSILNDLDAQFETFDILSDNEVRQGLKEYSNWPTYPQVYIRGELIGGLDIINEMLADGELQKIIPKKGALKDRLRVLVSRAPVMVFMKGNPETPKCGFSKTLIGILNGIGLRYETFDILEDEEVRQGLKEFSNWPTYPQVYAKGELIGGLDIIKELKETGDLKSSLGQRD